MRSFVSLGGNVRVLAAAVLGASLCASAPVRAGDHGDCDAPPPLKGPSQHDINYGVRTHPGPGAGTLGYGPPGVFPGFPGFGIGWHPGYGYGGAGLGPGAEGGYPFYGGPGYPHPWPTLRRIGGINPFLYYGGPGGPTPGCPNYFGMVAPLAVDPGVIEIQPEPGEADLASSFGPFTGAVPYPEAVLAPFTTEAASRGSSSGVITPTTSTPPGGAPTAVPAPPNASLPPAVGNVLNAPPPGGALGIEVEPALDTDGQHILKIAKIYPGGVADTAGLHDGDVIRSINGYATQQPGHLEWIIAHAAKDHVLNMIVRSNGDGKARSVQAKLP